MAKETYIRSGGAWRKATEIYIRSGSTWRDVKEAWLRIGGTWQQVFLASVVTLSGASVTHVFDGVTYAGVRINSDGTVDQRKNSTYTQLSSGTDWIIPNSAASGDTYEVYATKTGDTLDASSAALSTWINVSTNPQWTIADTTADDGADTATVTIQIRKNGGAAVDSGVYNLSANYFTL